MKVGTSTLIDLLHIIFVSFLKEKKKKKKIVIRFQLTTEAAAVPIAVDYYIK